LTIESEKIIEIKAEKQEEKKPCCPHCQSENVFGMSRVVGYFSIIDNWNSSKKAELKARQKGNYWTKEKRCNDCNQLAYPLGGNEYEGIFFCKEKGSRVTSNSLCEQVPIGRYYEYSDNPQELEKLKMKLLEE